MIIQKQCVMCGKFHTLEVSKESYELWLSGMHIQDAMPELTVDERELMISGVCGECFNEIFAEEEE